MCTNLKEQQLALTRYIRDPSRFAAPPGIDARRAQVYRELFFGGIEGLLAGCFPVLQASLDEAGWQALVHDFYANYRSHTPLFTEVARSFVDYLHGIDSRPPWQAELAHYEWVESWLYLSDAQDPAHDPEGDLLAGEPLLSSLAVPLAYRWPVDRIGPNFIPQKADDEPTLLLAYRNGQGQVKCARIGSMAYQLLTVLTGSGRDRLCELAQCVQADPQVVFERGHALLENLRTEGIIIGTRV